MPLDPGLPPDIHRRLTNALNLGSTIMRKIILAAAVAAATLGLAACSETAKEADDMAGAMAEDADAMAEDAEAMGEDAMAAADAAADEVSAAAEKAAAEAEAMVESE